MSGKDEDRGLMYLAEQVDRMEADLPDQIARAVEIAMRRVLQDEDLRRQFWAAGYKEMSGHAGTAATQWVGRRILSAIGGALLAFGLYLGFKFGGWGK